MRVFIIFATILSLVGAGLGTGIGAMSGAPLLGLTIGVAVGLGSVVAGACTLGLAMMFIRIDR